MHKIKPRILITLFFGFFVFSFNLANAEQCVMPTPPSKCYNTVTTEKPVDQFQGYIYIQKTTKQEEVPCGNTSEQIKYQTDLLHYNTCIQINKITDKTSTANTNSQVTNQNTSKYIQVCPLPTQPSTQSSLSVIDTASFGNGTTIKKYSDSSYAIFNITGQYEGVATQSMFDNAKNYKNYSDQLNTAVNTNSLEKISNLNYLLKTYADIGNTIQTSIDAKLSNKLNCPDPAPVCPINSTLSSANRCVCNLNFTATFKDYNKTYDAYETMLCIPKNSSASSSTSTLSTNNFMRTLRLGMSGSDVKALQLLLQKLNYISQTQPLSTYFGSVTNNALIKFQKDNKIQPAIGTFGPATQAKLILLTNN